MTINNAILSQLRRLNIAALNAPSAKILVLSGQAVLSDLHTKGAPMYSTPATGNWLARIHKFAAKRGVQIQNMIYIRQNYQVTA